MSRDTCKLCGDRGFIAVDETTDRQCICLYAKMLRNHLLSDPFGKKLVLAPNLGESPLYVIDPVTREVRVDRTRDNLFIKGRWNDIVSHIKWVLVCKGLKFRFRIATDELLRDVYLGKKAYSSRSKDVRDDQPYFNTLSDLLEEVDLAIIHLGVVAYKNAALPGILTEALMLRLALSKPTWLVEDEKEFGPGHRAYSMESADYIDRHFEKIDLSGSDRAMPVLDNRPVPLPGMTGDAPLGMVGSMTVEDHVLGGGGSNRRPQRSWKPDEGEGDDDGGGDDSGGAGGGGGDDMSVVMGGGGSKKRKGGRW